MTFRKPLFATALQPTHKDAKTSAKSLYKKAEPGHRQHPISIAGVFYYSHQHSEVCNWHLRQTKKSRKNHGVIWIMICDDLWYGPRWAKLLVHGQCIQFEAPMGGQDLARP